jgi:hypothetical protein
MYQNPLPIGDKHIPCLSKNQSVSACTVIITVCLKKNKKLKYFIGKTKIFVDEGFT